MQKYSVEEYRESYAELVELFRHFNVNILKKAPYKLLAFYKENANPNCNFQYDEDLPIDCQNVSRLTKIIYANLYIKYFADYKRKRQIKVEEMREKKEQENRKMQNYKPNEIFSFHRDSTISDSELINQTVNTVSLKAKKETFWTQILNKLKNLFK